ncbi:hypothetical protein GCM10027592_57150 [Spirosoma flavus]
MAHEEKGNKNTKKPATKAPKVQGVPRIPKYEQTESGIKPPDLARKAKK